jgi:hypothetical protein
MERGTGYSPDFIRVVADELSLVARKIDKLDARIEKAKRPSTKDELSAARATWVSYEKFLRQMLR